MFYDGIELTPPNGPVSMTHSVSLDIIRGQSSSQNLDYTEKLGALPWCSIQKYCPDSFNETCNLFSLLHMDYQVCNGGISQYFYNGYHEGKGAHHKDDVMLLDKESQESAFSNLVAFAKAVFPDKVEENKMFAQVCNLFKQVRYIENVPMIETIYSDEPEYIEDPDDPYSNIPNPDYEEPHDEIYYENVIENEEQFESAFYDISDYMEEVMELQAQYIFKALDRDLELEAKDFPEACDILTSIRCKNAPSLADRLNEARIFNQNEAGEKGRSIPDPERT